MTVHDFIPDFQGARKGRLRCKDYDVWLMPHTDCEVEDVLGKVIDVQGGINHKVTCRTCKMRRSSP